MKKDIIKNAFGLNYFHGSPVQEGRNWQEVDSADILKNFPAGVRWDQIGNQELDSSCYSFSFFNVDAFVYYLPAFLTRSLDNGEVREFLFYSLTPSQVSDADIRDKMQRLSEAQLNCVRVFICDAVTNGGYKITEEIRVFWDLSQIE